MRSRALVVLIAAVAVLAVAVPGLVFAQSAGAGQPQPTSGSAVTNTTIAIYPHPDGDARFRIITRFVLDNENETAAFQALAREFEDGAVGFSVSTLRRAANQSSIVTGRSMNITNVTRRTTIVGKNTSKTATGKLVLEFTWTNFARTPGDRIVVGDVFNTTHGTWLPRLTKSQVLVMKAPRGYAIIDSPIGFSNGTLRWEGPTTFESGSPSVTFDRRLGNRPTPPNGKGGTDPPTSIPVFALGASVVVLGVTALGAYALRRRRSADEHTTEDDEQDEQTESEETVVTQPDESAETELLSDEERIEQLLARNDGRMKQADIVTETGWSNAKVSQLLSAMDETGRVDKLRIGRENLISLPDEE